MSKTKICANPNHNEEVPISEFGNNKSKPDGLQPRCRVCQREYQKNHYNENLYRRTQIRKNKSTKVNEARNFIIDYLLTHPCVSCGEKRIVVLEFNHKRRFTKSHNVSDMVNSGYSIPALKKEIRKCEILCCNCHRLKTAKQFKYYTLGVQDG